MPYSMDAVIQGAHEEATETLKRAQDEADRKLKEGALDAPQAQAYANGFRAAVDLIFEYLQ